MKELDQIRARLEAATPGPWFANRFYVGAGEDQSDPDAEIAKASFKADAELIAHAPADIARLLAAVEAVEGFQEQAVGDKDDLYASRHAEGCNDMLNAIRAALAEALGGDQ